MLQIRRIAPLDQAGPGDLTFLDNVAYAEAASRTLATACFVAPKLAAKLNSAVIALLSPQPYRAMALAAAALYPDALRPAAHSASGIDARATVHAKARLEHGVVCDPGSVIGANAEIGAGTIVGANAVIGANVKIGRDCSIGANAVISHALIGNRVIVHPNASIGQDGFGFAMGPGGHLKVPQIGRVIIQDDVEIGAGTTIDRGANRDTTVGEGTKIDNQAQIGHNVTIGRHCVIVAQVGISGSAVLEDYVVIGGQAGVAGHLKLGMGARIGAQSGVIHDVPAGQSWVGAPAQPGKAFFRELTTLKKLARKFDKGSGES